MSYVHPRVPYLQIPCPLRCEWHCWCHQYPTWHGWCWVRVLERRRSARVPRPASMAHNNSKSTSFVARFFWATASFQWHLGLQSTWRYLGSRHNTPNQLFQMSGGIHRECRPWHPKPVSEFGFGWWNFAPKKRIYKAPKNINLCCKLTTLIGNKMHQKTQLESAGSQAAAALSWSAVPSYSCQVEMFFTCLYQILTHHRYPSIIIKNLVISNHHYDPQANE